MGLVHHKLPVQGASGSQHAEVVEIYLTFRLELHKCYLQVGHLLHRIAVLYSFVSSNYSSQCRQWYHRCPLSQYPITFHYPSGDLFNSNINGKSGPKDELRLSSCHLRRQQAKEARHGDSGYALLRVEGRDRVHVARVEEIQVPHLGLEGGLGAPADEILVVAVGGRVAVAQGVRGPLDIKDGGGAAAGEGRDVQVEDGLVCDLAQHPLLGQRVVRAPVAVDGDPGVDLADDARKVRLPGPLARHADVPLGHQLRHGVHHLGPDVYAHGLGDIVVERPQFIALAEIAGFLWGFHGERSWLRLEES